MGNKKQKTVTVKSVQVVARRDSAVAIIRKLGIPPGMYKSFVSKLADGQWAAQVSRAKNYLGQIKTPAAGSGAVDEHKVPISQTCLALFRDGKQNGEIWECIKAKYGLDDEKKGYPAWYRSYFRRRGDLPAVEPRHAR